MAARTRLFKVGGGWSTGVGGVPWGAAAVRAWEACCRGAGPTRQARRSRAPAEQKLCAPMASAPAPLRTGRQAAGAHADLPIQHAACAP